MPPPNNEASTTETTLAPAPVPASQPRSLWRNRDYLLLWSSQVISSVGTRVSGLAYPLLVLFLGAERAALLTSYWADDPHRVLVLRDAHGQMAGYLIAQSRTIGPWVACNAEGAEWLLRQALTLPFKGEPVVLVSASHHEALHLLRNYSFRQQDSLRHMRKGNPVPRGRQTTLYGQASLGFG